MKLANTVLSALVALAIMHRVIALPHGKPSQPFVRDYDSDDEHEVLYEFYDDGDDRRVSPAVEGGFVGGNSTHAIAWDDDPSDDDSDDHDDHIVRAKFVGRDGYDENEPDENEPDEDEPDENERDTDSDSDDDDNF